MEEPTVEDANPMKSIEDEPIPDPPEAATPGTGKMSDEMQLELKRLLRGTNRGRALMAGSLQKFGQRQLGEGHSSDRCQCSTIRFESGHLRTVPGLRLEQRHDLSIR